MGQAEHEGGHIWLRQSATFSVNGQTRTVEIAIPLRPGADADEVERLLSEADAGMERLTRHLDDRVAALTDGAADVPAAAPTKAQPAPAARPATPPPAAAPAPASAPASAAPATATPTAAQRTPAASANAPRPAASQPAPAARPTPSPSPAPAAGRSTSPLPAAATGAAGADITRIEFIKAAGELGLDVRQAMQRLGVRSLEGLNLRESLELLRRQALREDDEPAAPAPAPVSAPPAAARTAATPPPAPRPAAATPQPAPYFDEEDEPELTFTIDGDDELDDEYGAYPMGNGAREPVPAGENEYDEVDELELDDVPDFGPPPAAAGSAGRRIPAGRGSAASQAAPAAKPPTASAAAAPAAPSAPVSEASELIAHLRAAHSGGAMSSQQRKAYQNIVVDELGETRATGLIKGIWNVSPERLGTEQADELLSWGKRETFADEATQVLAELRAERERERGAGGTAGSGGTSARATGSAPRSGTQTRTPGSRTPSGGGGF